MKESLIVLGLLGLVVFLALLQPQFPSVPFQTVALGEESGLRSQEALVITTEEGWQELWERHVSSSRRPPPLPQIDFSTEMVIALFGGSQPEGVLLQITRIEKRPGRLLVHYALSGPACSKCALPTGLVQPFHIIRLERLDLPVVFSRD